MKGRLLAAGLVCVVATVGAALAQGGKPAPEGGEQDFGNKVLAVTLNSPHKDFAGSGGYIEQAKVRRLGDRYFLVGRMVEVTEQYKGVKGIVIWWPVSEVGSISEFDSLDQARKKLEEYEQANPKRGGTE